MQPITTNNPNLYKGPSSSAEFNKLRNDIHYDLTQLFNMANDNEENIKRNMDVLIRENFFLQNKIIGLEKQIDKIGTDLLYKNQGLRKQRLIKSFFSLDGLQDGDAKKEAYINTVYGYLTVPPSGVVSKLSYKSPDGQVIIPVSLKADVYESTNTQPVDDTTGMRTYYTIEDDNVFSAFDRDSNTFWVHTSSFPEDSGVSEVFGNIHIQVPLDVINDAYSNTLILNPFPEYSLRIRDIQVKGYGGQWYRLPNYPTEKDGNGNEVPVEIQDAGKLTFSFPKSEITEIQVLFSQPYWFSSEGQREFVYGFQEIQLEHRIVNYSTAASVQESSTASEIVAEFSLEGTTKRFSTIDSPTIETLIGTGQEIDSLVSYKLYYNKDLTNEFSFGYEIMAPVQKVYVKISFMAAQEVIPMIRQINLDFTFKELDEF